MLSKNTIILLFIIVIVFIIGLSFFNKNSNKKQTKTQDNNKEFWNKNRYDEHRDDIFLEDD